MNYVGKKEDTKFELHHINKVKNLKGKAFWGKNNDSKEKENFNSV